MNKQYTLIVGHNFSLSNETDADIMSDYNPGIWAIKTQKMALKYAHKLLEDGDTIKVTDYNNPAYHALANKFIKELGIDQPLFDEPSTLRPILSVPTNGKPATLGALKKYLAPGLKIHLKNYQEDGTIRNERDTEIKRVQTNAIVVMKEGGTADSFLEFGNAKDWTFDNEGANKNFISHEGKYVLSIRIEY